MRPILEIYTNAWYTSKKCQYLGLLSIERNPFPAKNQTLRSYRVYIFA